MNWLQGRPIVNEGIDSGPEPTDNERPFGRLQIVVIHSEATIAECPSLCGFIIPWL